MRCREFEERLQEVVDLRRDPRDDADLDGHATICAECSSKFEWFSALARMTEAFGASRGPGAAVDYDRSRLIRQASVLPQAGDDQIVLPAAAVEPVVLPAALPEPVRRRSRLLLAGSGLAVAAGVALFVTLAFLPWSPSDPSQIAAQSSPAESDPSVEADPVVAPSVPSPGTMAVAANVQPEPALSLEQLRVRLTQLPSDPPVSGSLRPIATSFGIVWETVRSALPNGRAETDPTRDQADVGGSLDPAVA